MRSVPGTSIRSGRRANTSGLRELRYAPPTVLLSMTTYIYDDKAAFISSKKENYGMIFLSEGASCLHESLFE